MDADIKDDAATVSRKIDKLKVKKILKLSEILSKDSGNLLSKSKVDWLILKNQLDEFPPNLSAHLNSNYFY